MACGHQSKGCHKSGRAATGTYGLYATGVCDPVPLDVDLRPGCRARYTSRSYNPPRTYELLYDCAYADPMNKRPDTQRPTGHMYFITLFLERNDGNEIDLDDVAIFADDWYNDDYIGSLTRSMGPVSRQCLCMTALTPARQLYTKRDKPAVLYGGVFHCHCMSAFGLECQERACLVARWIRKLAVRAGTLYIQTKDA